MRDYLRIGFINEEGRCHANKNSSDLGRRRIQYQSFFCYNSTILSVELKPSVPMEACDLPFKILEEDIAH